MIEIIPAILTDSAEELVRQVHILERAGVTRAHLDVCDGVFVPKHTILGYSELERLPGALTWDVHLMVANPEEQLARWQDVACVKRFLIPVETAQAFPALAAQCHEQHRELWATLNPDTPMDQLPSVSDIDGVCFMTVHPGQQGSPFVPEVLEHIRAYRAEHADMPIMADGGMRPETALQCTAAGATILVSGSYLFTSMDITQALQELRAAVVQ